MQQNGHTIMQTDDLTGGLVSKQTGQADGQTGRQKVQTNEKTS